MAEIEHGEGGLAEGGIELIGLVELAFNFFALRFEIGEFGHEQGFVDGAGEIAIEEAILHVFQFRAAFGEYLFSLGLDGSHIVECC